jgi:hypothetical protein
MAAQGYFLIANGTPVNMAENQLSFPRQMEAHRAPQRAYEVHLYTPLAFTVANPSIEVIRETLMRGAIPFRAAPGAKSEVLKHFFPLTITALGQGYIIGEERVVTAVSGTFRPTSAKGNGSLFLFDAEGKLTTTQDVNLATEIQVDVPSDGLAVLVAGE